MNEQSTSPTEPVFLALENYYTTFQLGIDGIESWPFQENQVIAEPEIPQGKYAMSVNQVYESPWSLRNRDGSFGSIDLRPLAYLRHVEPIGWAGYSNRLYSVEQLLAAYAASDATSLGRPREMTLAFL